MLNDINRPDNNNILKEIRESKVKFKFTREIYILLLLIFSRVIIYGISFIQVLTGIKNKVNPSVIYNFLNSFRTMGYVPILVITTLYLFIKKKYKLLGIFLILDIALIWILFYLASNYIKTF